MRERREQLPGLGTWVPGAAADSDKTFRRRSRSEWEEPAPPVL